jgi:hypothetical protein
MSGALAGLAGGNTKSESEVETCVVAAELPAGAGTGFVVSRIWVTEAKGPGSMGALSAFRLRRRDIRLLCVGMEPGPGSGVGTVWPGTTRAVIARVAVIADSGINAGAETTAWLTGSAGAAVESAVLCGVVATSFKVKAVALPCFSLLPNSPPGIPRLATSNFMLRINACIRNEISSA